jgi:hypothetical protein
VEQDLHKWHNDYKQRKERQEKNMEIKEPYAVVQYNKFIKGVDMQTSTSVLRKTVKLSTKFLLYLLNCVLFDTFFVCTKH